MDTRAIPIVPISMIMTFPIEIMRTQILLSKGMDFRSNYYNHKRMLREIQHVVGKNVLASLNRTLNRKPPIEKADRDETESLIKVYQQECDLNTMVGGVRIPFEDPLDWVRYEDYGGVAVFGYDNPEKWTEITRRRKMDAIRENSYSLKAEGCACSNHATPETAGIVPNLTVSLVVKPNGKPNRHIKWYGDQHSMCVRPIIVKKGARCIDQYVGLGNALKSAKDLVDDNYNILPEVATGYSYIVRDTYMEAYTALMEYYRVNDGYLMGTTERNEKSVRDRIDENADTVYCFIVASATGRVAEILNPAHAWVPEVNVAPFITPQRKMGRSSQLQE